MDFTRGIFILTIATFVTSKSISIDYDTINDNDGNGVNNAINFQSNRDYHDADYDLNANSFERVSEAVKRDPEKYELAYANDDKKRNILSALRMKMRRSDITDAEEKYKFAPVLSVDALNNLNGFFDNLANNIHTMESRNLLPNQLRLLGEAEYRPRDPGQYRHSAAYINSIRSFAPSQSIRKLYSYQPGINIHSYQSHPMITKFGDDNLLRKDRRS